MSNVKQEVRRERQAKFPASVYFAIGDESWGKGQFMDMVKKDLVDPSMLDFNFDQLHASEVSGVAATDKAGMLPMMADRRVVTVLGCDAWKKKDLDALAAYLKSPNEKTCLVLDFQTADRRRKIFQGKPPHIRYFEFARPKSWELPRYIRELAREMGLQLTDDALGLVAELVGEDLEHVHSQLDKLGLYKLDAGPIAADDVAKLLGRTRLVTRWELNDFIGNRDLGGALMKCGDILESGEEPLGLLSSINRYFKQLFLVKTMVTGGVRDQNQIARTLGVRPRIAGTLMQKQRAFSNVELRRAIDLIARADSRLKSAGVNRRLIVDHLLCTVLLPGEFSPPGVGAKTKL